MSHRITVALAACALSGATWGQSVLQVTGMSPAPNAVGVPTAATIELQFSAPLDPATVTPATAGVAGRWSGVVPGAWVVDPSGMRLSFVPARPFFAGELVYLQLSRGIHASTGGALTGGFTASFWAACSPGAGIFALDRAIAFRRPGEGPIGTYGFYAGDIDRDGSPDMSATNEISFDVRLLTNGGCGDFGVPRVTPLPVLNSPSPSEGADLDGDGWLDLATGNLFGRSFAVFRNDGAGAYLPPVVYPVGGQSVHGLALGDIEGDGDLDALVTNRDHIVVLRNDGNGNFGNATTVEAGTGEYGVATGDANGDGIVDLFCGLSSTAAVSVLLGDGNGGFNLASTTPCGGFAWAVGLGDLDRDGHLDCVVANHFQGAVAVLFGNGDGTLQPARIHPVGLGTRPLSIDLADLDGDGDLDVTTANFGTGNASVLRNDGNGALSPWSVLPAYQAGSCTVLADFDRDGDLDICVVDEISDEGYLYLQADVAPSGIAAPSCASALRLDNLAARAGFGIAAPHFVTGASTLFLGLGGAAGAPFLLLGGDPAPVPLATAFGPLSLSVIAPLLVFANGSLDATGEITLPLTLPPGLPTGAQLAFQGLVLTAGPAAQLTNPELARVR